MRMALRQIYKFADDSESVLTGEMAVFYKNIL